MREIKIANRINVDIRIAAFANGERVKPTEETSHEIAQSRWQIQNIGRADHGKTAWLEHTKDFAQQRAGLFEVLDCSDAGDQTKPAIEIRQLIGIGIDEVHPLGGIFHQRIGIITSTGTKTETPANRTHQFAAATCDIEGFARKRRLDICARECVKHRVLNRAEFRAWPRPRFLRPMHPSYDFAYGQRGE